MTPAEVAQVRKLKGTMSAVAVSHMYRCNPETVRKLWRGETYKELGEQARPLMQLDPAAPLPEGSDELLAELFKQQATGVGPKGEE